MRSQQGTEITLSALVGGIFHVLLIDRLELLLTASKTNGVPQTGWSCGQYIMQTHSGYITT